MLNSTKLVLLLHFTDVETGTGQGRDLSENAKSAHGGSRV